VPIYLPATTQSSTESLTPRQIVAELDKYVIGQKAAKRAVAIALRNRALHGILADDVLIEFGHDLARRHLVQSRLLLFRISCQIDNHCLLQTNNR